MNVWRVHSAMLSRVALDFCIDDVIVFPVPAVPVPFSGLGVKQNWSKKMECVKHSC